MVPRVPGWTRPAMRSRCGRRIAGCLLVLVLCTCADISGQSAADEDLSSFRIGAKGAELVQRGDFGGAARAFETVIRLEPALFQGHYSLAVALLNQCRFDASADAFARALARRREQGQMRAEVLKGRAVALHALAKLAAEPAARSALLGRVAGLLAAADAAHPGSVAPDLMAAVQHARGRGGVEHLLHHATGDRGCADELGREGQAALAAAEDAARRGRRAEAEAHVSRAVAAFNGARVLLPDEPAVYRGLEAALRAQLALAGGGWGAAAGGAALLGAAELRAALEAAGGRGAQGRERWPPLTAPFFSQVGQDAFIHTKLLTDAARRAAGVPTERGVFFEAGAVDGLTNSNTLFFERTLGWTGVCVEPSPWHETLLALRPNCTSLRMALGGAGGGAIQRFVFGRGGNALCQQRGGLAAGMDAEGWASIRQDCGSVEEADVRSAPLGALLRERALRHIDLMSLDLEGGELNALRSVDWGGVTILVLCIERNEAAGGAQVQGLLEEQGYTLSASLAQDDIYVHPRLAQALRTLKSN